MEVPCAQCGGEIFSRKKAIKFYGFRKTVSRFLEEKIPADVPAEKVVLFFSADGTVPQWKKLEIEHTQNIFFRWMGGFQWKNGRSNMGKKEWEESVVLVFAVGGHR
jgi:hypothetical protein